MKKYIVPCFLCFCLYGSSRAQIYLKGYMGYALATGNDKLISTEIINNDRYASSCRLKNGQGVNLGLGIGYDLNANIAFEITGNTQLFSKFRYSNPYQWDFTYDPEESYYIWSTKGFFGDLEYSNTMFQVSPQIVFKSNPYNQWTFYLKGGPDFIWVTSKQTTQTPSIDFSFSSSSIAIYKSLDLYTTEYSGNINTGIQCSFGTEYELSKTICVFAEITTVNVRYTFKHSKILRYESDGVDLLSTLGSTVSDGLNERTVFNHVGLNMGLKYTFR